MSIFFESIIQVIVNFFGNFLPESFNKDNLKVYVERFLIGVFIFLGFLISYTIYSSFKTTKEDDVVDEFVIKKDFKNATFNNLDVYSAATAKKVIVKGPINIYGSFITENSNYKDANIYGALKAIKTTFQDINVYGATELNAVTVRDLEVYGALNATEFTVLNDLFIAGFGTIQKSKINFCEVLGDRLTISDSTFKKLKVSNTEKKKAIIHLNNGSIDTVIFDSIPGEVFLYGEAKVQTVKGGTLIKAKEPFKQNKDEKILTPAKDA